MDAITARLDTYDDRIDKIERTIQSSDNRVGELTAQNENADLIVREKFEALTKRVAELEEKLAALADIPNKVRPLENLPGKVDLLAENVEDRTNRQLRETLVFKNIPEEERDSSYKETKELLARVINQNCPEISYQDAYNQIKRAHREAKKTFEGGQNSRDGKRLIFAAFHSWDMCQHIIESFRQKCISEPRFNIAAEQKYGPLTSRRRQLAFQLRRQLKDSGAIISAYVDFPAKLMVNYPGEVRADNKKVYKLHTNFSRHPVE